jgi:YtxH-like protein
MFNSPTPSRTASSIPRAPAPGSIPQPKPDGLPQETVPDWNNIGLFTAGIAVGAILGATVALLLAPASGDRTRDRIVRRFRGADDDVWEELAEELELAAAEKEEEASLSAES